MKIITGHKGDPHIEPEQDRAVHQGIVGKGSYIFNVGNNLAAEVVSANEIRILDGALSFQGCYGAVVNGTYDTLEIANGAQGMQRRDLIVARYSKTGRIESMELAVIQGTPAESNPATPAHNSGFIADGDSPVDFPLYRVNINGINITSVTRLVDVMGSIEDVRNRLGGSYLPAGTNINNLTQEHSGWWAYARDDVSGTFPLSDTYGTIGHIQGTSNNNAMQILRSNNQGSASGAMYVRHKVGGTWGTWKRYVDATTTNLEISRIENSYVNATAATYLSASKKNGQLTFRCNLQLTSPMPTTSHEIGIARIAGWNAGNALLTIAPQAGSGAGTLLVNVTSQGTVIISNYSDKACSGWYRDVLTMPCTDGTE